MSYGYLSNRDKPIYLYRNIWILILNHFPEALWCKLYLNHTFINLIKSQKSLGTITELSLKGKLYSLENQKPCFYSLCQSNIYAVKHYCFYNKNLDYNQGAHGACQNPNLDIIKFLLKLGATATPTILILAIANGWISLLKSIGKLKDKTICYDDQFIVLADDNVIQSLKTKIGIDFAINNRVRICSCKDPQKHYSMGPKGIQGYIGSCSKGIRGPKGLTGVCSGSNCSFDYTSKNQKKQKRKTWVTYPKKYQKP